MLYWLIPYLALAIMVLCGGSIFILMMYLLGHSRKRMALGSFCRLAIPTITRCLSIAVLAIWITTYRIHIVVDATMVAVAVAAVLLTVLLMFLWFVNLLAVRLLYLRFERYVLDHLSELDEDSFVSMATSYVCYISIKQNHEVTDLMRLYILGLATRLGFCTEHFPSYLYES